MGQKVTSSRRVTAKQVPQHRSPGAARRALWRKRHPEEHLKQQRDYHARKRAAKKGLEALQAEQRRQVAARQEQARLAHIAELNRQIRERNARYNEAWLRAKAGADAAGLSIEAWLCRMKPEEAAKWADVKDELISAERLSKDAEAAWAAMFGPAEEEQQTAIPFPPDSLAGLLAATIEPEEPPLHILPNGMIDG